MVRKENLLLLIDLQNDFCQPHGSLFVPGAREDIERIVTFIDENIYLIDHMVLTADHHQVLDIAHPGFWINSDGEHPAPFTQITAADLKNGKWIPLQFKDEAVKYIYDLEEKGEFIHTIWPEHCIAGSEGAAIDSRIMEAVKKWSRKGHFFDLVTKGTYPLTEHFGALRANIPSPSAPGSQLNMDLVKKIMGYERLIIAGEAKSHCVANTIKQILELTDFNRELVILDDCMSNVPGFESVAGRIFHRAGLFGAKTVKSTELKLT